MRRRARLEVAAGRPTAAVATVLSLALGFCASTVRAEREPRPLGKPPAELEPIVEAPKSKVEEAKIERPGNGTSMSLSAGGQLATGNSRMAAATVNSVFEKRLGDDGVGASLLGNYGRSAAPGKPLATTAENLQGRVRYDRYVTDDASVFMLNTGRHDRFQGIDFRYNVDPGFKYLFVKVPASSLWGEVGYDFQYDVRHNSARVVLDGMDMPVLGPGGTPVMLPKTSTDHSARVFGGFKHAFNGEVTFTTGIEYLQSFVHSGHYRFNYDALFAAKVVGGLAVGLGFSARYDHVPLSGKNRLDTATTVSLIYSYSDPEPEQPPPPPCPPPEPAPEAPAPPVPAVDAAPTAPAPVPEEPPASEPAPESDPLQSTTDTPAP